MTAIQQAVIDKLQGLSSEDLQKVLRFVEMLNSPASPVSGRKSLRGRFAYLNVHLSAGDIAAARQEAWANFPRDITLD